MHVNKHLGVILLSVWLILTGLIALFSLSFTGLGIVMGILAIAAGAALLFTGGHGITHDVGVIILAIWLILNGLISLVSFQFNGLEIVMAILAVVAGVAIIFKSGYITAHWGVLLLGIWLIVSGLMTLISLSFAASGVIMGIIALAAGILLLIDT